MTANQIKFPQLIKVGCGIVVQQNLIVATIMRSDEAFRQEVLMPTQVL